jgi:hypothetical protein
VYGWFQVNTDQKARCTDQARLYPVRQKGDIIAEKVIRNFAEWKKNLPPMRYSVTREREQRFTG